MLRLTFLVWLAVIESVTAFPRGAPRILRRETDLSDEYDYVIIGGGTAGLTVADRLSADEKYTVLVIENAPVQDGEPQGGGAPSMMGSSYDIVSVPQPEMGDRTQVVTVGRVLGGCSAINGMMFLRGTKDEYDGWAEIGGDDSTWDWEGMFPYFKRASYFTPPREQFSEPFNITYDMDMWGQDPDTHIYASFAENANPRAMPLYDAMAKMPGMDLPLDCNSGDNGLCWYPSSIDPENFARSYAKTGHYDNIKRDNYHLIGGSRVNKIILEDDVASAVQFVPSDGEGEATVVKARKEVILSAGTVHTPQVLQLSGIGPKSLLEEADIPVVMNLPGVGQKFQDQGYVPSVTFRWGANGGPPAPQINLTGARSGQTSPNLGIHIGLPVVSPDTFKDLSKRYAEQDPAAYLPEGSDPAVVKGYAAFQKLHAKLMKKKNASFLSHSLTGGSPGGYAVNLHTLSHGTININPKDPEAEPLVDYRALTNPIDVDVMIALVRFIRSYMASEALAEYEPAEISPGAEVESDEDLTAWIRATYIPTVYHPVGTAAMMPLELGGVVDETLTVHGTRNLRVVDASIMPSLPGAPTSQTVYMIAEKAVDYIQQSQ